MELVKFSLFTSINMPKFCLNLDIIAANIQPLHSGGQLELQCIVGARAGMKHAQWWVRCRNWLRLYNCYEKPDIPVFSSPQTPTFPNFNSIRNSIYLS